MAQGGGVRGRFFQCGEEGFAVAHGRRWLPRPGLDQQLFAASRCPRRGVSQSRYFLRVICADVAPPERPRARSPFLPAIRVIGFAGMSSGGGESTNDLLQREVLELRARVAELQRSAARYQATDGISLGEREELLRAAEMAAHLGTWAWDIESGRVTWSEEMYRILGLDPEQIIPSVEAFFARIHPDDRQAAQRVTEQGLRDGVLPLFDCRVVRPDGGLRFITTSGSYVFDDTGNARRMVGSVLDQTSAVGQQLQLRRALSLLEEAQAMAQLGSWRFDPGTGEVEWSREFRRIAGFSADEKATVESFLSRIVPEDLPRFLEMYQKSLVAPESGSAEARLLRPNGEMRYVRIMGELVDGPYARRELRGTLLDITDQVRLRNELAHAYKMETVGRLAGGIAHDFNNLLTVVLGNLEVLQFNVGEHGELTECFRALESASNLTRRLLAFGRRAQLSLKVVDPNELVASTMHLMHRLVGDQIVLRTKLGAQLPMISVDTVEMERALVNLVINARDFTPVGGEVLIETHQSEEQGKIWVNFSVVDHGPGIDAADVSQVFEPFFTTRGHAGGSGLGLATVLGTAEQHGGSARVTTPAHGGSVFTISLPGVLADAPRSASERESLPLMTEGRWSILVIDDEPKVADVTRLILSALGHEVRVATSHEDALAVWRAQGDKFDLVLCDVVMPGLRGPELVVKMADVGATPRVLFMSGYNEEGIQSHPVIAKPFSAQVLQNAIALCMRQRVCT